MLPLVSGDRLITIPFSWLKIRQSAKIFANHRGVKIAVAGSYGKTTMKEILLSVLSEGKKVAATPANKNVAISHARFASNLTGDEEILIIEFGEGAPGDVVKFSKTTKPSIGIITGLAPAHLDKYKTLQKAGEDIFSLATYLNNKNVYVNDESPDSLPFIKKSYLTYSRKGAEGWKVSDLKSTISGLNFKLKKGSISLDLKSSLLGEHQVGPLLAAAVIAHDLGLSKLQIEHGIAKIKSFEHRMQPRQMSGAWIIDDTYNGNIEGMLAGLKLLKDLPAQRKIYVTPGLVDQGRDSSKIHNDLGAAIAKAKPDLVVLMQHSVTEDIIAGVKKGVYKGELVIEDDPLNFYTHLDQFIAAGDLVLLQNDWPDNYK
jgi:UDP-N-acetylmuramoyl-tripeptide--D-alanyl-D-alanine ligase